MGKWHSLSHNKQDGFTLVELLAVIVILSIIVVIAVPSIGNLVEQSQIDVCEANQQQVARLYQEHMALKGITHSESLFNQFLTEYYQQPLCPTDGIYTYITDDVACSVHDQQESDNGGGSLVVGYFI
ncbi:late competence protein ComGC [Gracilibacillus boraciitolerans JCM 21714]|uniref:Late competence protein ComGC n=1 Tax=Gracilibacillus boraciitolerans JCM 21714 TaxID=1298598 RepID=W4VQN2_9BACI|nr:prepilin-type N-terminal cleavage/methylation domain-containing protein [Gracilibacillus boraciitolerans]GAE95223.1 late competence protein ComGC [Gracilibacillus boraciitolerans JCM 21714]